MACPTYCTTALPEFSVNNCNETIASGGKNAILFNCQSEAVANSDYTTATIQADIAAGYATVMESLMIDAPDASPNPAAASYVAGVEPKTKNYTQTLTISDENVSVANDTAYEDLDATTGNEIAAIIVTTAGGHSELYEAITAFTTTITKPVSGSVDDSIHYVATVTGKMLHKSKMIATPANIYS